MSVRHFTYLQYDVFTRTPLTGNQLAVFLDARQLREPELMDITREFNHSETTFVYPRTAAEEAAKGIRVRIFGRQGEMQFAGHPTLGTATALYQRLTKPANKITLDLPVGPIPVFFEPRPEGIYGEMLQNDPEFKETYTRDQVAAALGVAASDIDDRYPLEHVSSGRPVLPILLKSLKSIQSLQVNWALAAKLPGMYILTRETVNPKAMVHARRMAPGGEDPATGSAAGPAIAWLVKHKIMPSGGRVFIEQGLEMNRPSELYGSARLVGDRITDLRVGGYSVEVLQGELSLNP